MNSITSKQYNNSLSVANRSRLESLGPQSLKLLTCSGPKDTCQGLAFSKNHYKLIYMVWTLALSTYLNDAPWENGATKAELIDYAERTGAPSAVIENLQEIEYEDDLFYSIEDIWEDIPTTDYEFGWRKDEN